MPKKSISSLELSALVQELQYIIKGKITQIYHQDNNEFLLQLHVPSQGKQLLKIIPGKWLCLTKNKDVPERPSGLCLQLRKYLDQAFIKNFYQWETERIVVFELEKSEKYYLIVEFFSKGNVLLTDKDYNIIAAMEKQFWKERTLKAKEKYLPPSGGVNWRKLTEKELAVILQKSEKKNLATSLATEIGIGGLYAEELCKRSGIDKTKIPAEVSGNEVKSLLKSLKELLKLLEEPKGYVYAEDVTPLLLLDQIPLKMVENYNLAIDALNPFVIKSPYQKKIETIQRMVASQEEAIQKQQDLIAENSRKGELIYEKYADLQKLLDIVKEMRKTKEWKEVEAELKKVKKIKKVDLKDKKVILEF